MPKVRFELTRPFGTMVFETTASTVPPLRLMKNTFELALYFFSIKNVNPLP